MPKVRVGQNSKFFFIGFEPPLTPKQLEKLPNPYARDEGAEIAGWPGTSIVTRSNASEMILGLFKDTLTHNVVSRIPSSEFVDFERIPAESLDNFLVRLSTELSGVEFDPVLYDAEPRNGAVQFMNNDGNGLFRQSETDCA